MAKKNLDLTPEEHLSLQRDNKLMETVRKVNEQIGSPIEQEYPIGAIPAGDVIFNALIDRPDARARLKTAISSGADVNEKGPNNYTALHGAAENGHIENVELLVLHGADCFAKTENGKTPIDYAHRNGHTKIVEFLLAQGKSEGGR